MARTDEDSRSEADKKDAAVSSRLQPVSSSAFAAELSALEPAKVERLAALGMFATGVVHELLSPIASIRMAAQHAQEISDPERSRRILAAIVEASDRCRRAVEGVMRFVKDEVAEKRPVDIETVLRRALGVIQSELQPLELAAHLDVHESVATVPCDSVAVEHAFVSVIRNATQSSPKATTLAIRCVRDAGVAVITFTDDGPSIAEPDLELIFEPFYTARDRGGSGMGLALARRIVAAHGGTIRAVAAGKRGAQFEVRLPLL